MARLPGLFQRSGTYYLRVVVPADLRAIFNERTKVVMSLGTSTFREAQALGARERADLLSHFEQTRQANARQKSQIDLGYQRLWRLPTTPVQAVVPAPAGTPLINVHLRWVDSQSRSNDSIAACRRAVSLFEEFAGQRAVEEIRRSLGDQFRAWLQSPERATTPKTARDRLTWVKSLLKYAARDLELIPKSPWEGLDIAFVTTQKRRPWTAAELEMMFGQHLFAEYALPTDTKAGQDAGYWIPLLGIYTGARIGELAQLNVTDIDTSGPFPTLRITDEGVGQHVKTSAGIRRVPIHSELLRLGFLEFVTHQRAAGVTPLWPELPKRSGKPGGYFSQWFGHSRRMLGLGDLPDFHCFRHGVRTQLAERSVAEPIIDALLGHEIKGSTGAQIYTHRSVETLQSAVELIRYPGLSMPCSYLKRHPASTPPPAHSS